MERDMKRSGIMVAVPVPAHDGSIYRTKATDDVLAALSRHPDQPFSIGDLSRTTEHTKPTVSRAVDDLLANELVLEESEGNKRLIRINAAHMIAPDDPFLQIPQREFESPVRAAVTSIRDELEEIVAIVLYGSVARGTADRRSDIDLWVLVERDRTEAQRRANEVRLDLEDRTFDNERFFFDIDVEETGAIPRYTEDIRGILRAGIPVFRTAEYEKIERILLAEVKDP
ncbi:MAG: nucleotidyltransferase domain-containing protein [Natrialbaceae archaeon]|nr:nucleotidyltransferase domain-containing protein [Natrialbaceae archaeon]